MSGPTMQSAIGEPGEPVPPMTDILICGARTSLGICDKERHPGKPRCYLHGGAPGSGAPKGNQNAVKHGLRAAAALAERKREREDAKALREERRSVVKALSNMRRRRRNLSEAVKAEEDARILAYLESKRKGD